jgi:hypothetical protein
MHKSIQYETCQNELEWSAFCYAAGELSAPEAALFEQRLATDQAAREALARTIELTQAVAAAETLEPVTVRPSGRSFGGRRIAWLAIGTAAAVLVAVIVGEAMVENGNIGTRLTGLVGSRPAAADARELAAAWSQTRRELADASDANLWFADHLDALAGESANSSNGQSHLGQFSSSPSALGSFDDTDIPVTPDWMTAAVLGSAELPAEGPASPDDPQSTDGDNTPFDGDRREN